MASFSPAGPARTVFSGTFFKVFIQPMLIGDKVVEFERVLRPPGVRLLIVKDGNIVITREYRSEHDSFDYRLPGGKVFDDLPSFLNAQDGQILRYAEEAARRECLEETGLLPKDLRHVHTSVAGAAIEWDLYYFVIEDFEQRAQELQPGEDIEVLSLTFDAAKKLCLEGDMREDRSVGVLLRFLGTRGRA